MNKNTIFEEYDLADFCQMIRATITGIQNHVSDETNKLSRDAIYYQAEQIRLVVDLIESVTAQPIEDRLTVSEIRRLTEKMGLTAEQLNRLFNADR